ncbi:MAG: Trm112 family protein [Gemmatimonadota bacterium]|jgi:uncharacterized protein YbaR (Trm112 family)|nr:Trm112 family protein [Gemmatimonadota bacterium]
MLESRLLEILVCPKCGGKLTEIVSPPSLQCPGCQLSYPVKDGIPVLLIDEATPVVVQ